MSLEEIAAWHRKIAQQHRNEAEGQRWSADHNPTRRTRALKQARWLDGVSVWHDQAATEIELVMAVDEVMRAVERLDAYKRSVRGERDPGPGQGGGQEEAARDPLGV